jgi:NADP-dependent 3-hydroxy acid dehydrogenase YdfG
MDISHKVVLITGASKGIGMATARSFAKAGAKLCLTARSADLLAELADELNAQGGEAVAFPADLCDPARHGRQRANPSIPVDSPEYVADKILAAAIGELEEQYMDR